MKPTLKIFIVILAIAAFGTVGYFFWQDKESSTGVDNLSALPDISIPTELQSGDETIPLTWTDNNDGENLIIQSDQKYYDGSGNVEVFFSITNASGKDQKTKIYFWFDGEDKKLAEVEKIGDDKISNFPASPAGGQFPISNEFPMPQFSKRKDIKGYATGSRFEDVIKTGATNFYKAIIKYPADSSGEFLIESFGDKAYGLLDPYFSSGLVGYWPFDGDDINWSTATAYDRSVQGNNGTITNMSQSTSPQPGKIGQALYFDRSNDYVNAGDIGICELDAFTVSAWIKVMSYTNYPHIYAEGNSANNTPLLEFEIDQASGVLVAYLRDNAGVSMSMGGGSALNDGNWHHAVLTQSSKSARELYLDGVSIDTDSTTLGAINVDRSRIGVLDRLIGLNYYFSGLIDEPRIYSRALSPDEVASHYRTGTRKISLKVNTDTGDGSDGALTVASADTVINTYTYITDATSSAGASAINVNSAAGFSTGDEILIIQTQHSSNYGAYEFKNVSSINGNQINLSKNLANSYYSGTYNAASSSVTQVVRVPQYTTVTVNNGASITAPAWDGYTGGVVVFRAQGQVNVVGSINLNSKGYRGGVSATRGPEGYNGNDSRNGGGTGGNGGYLYSACGDSQRIGQNGTNGAGGGGSGGDNGGFGSPGGNASGGTGGYGADSCGANVAGGSGGPYGGGGGGSTHGAWGGGGGGRSYDSMANNSSNNLGAIVLGGGASSGASAGNAGYSYQNGSGGNALGTIGANGNPSSQSGNGNPGGGIIMIFADSMSVSGSIAANGGNGGVGGNSSNGNCVQSYYYCGGGGGGGQGGNGASGGSVYMAVSGTLNIAGSVTATGGSSGSAGSGGSGGSGGGHQGGNGAAGSSGSSGSSGKIALEFDSIAGTTNPSYYPAHYLIKGAQINSSLNNRWTNGLVGFWSFNGPDMDYSQAYEVRDRSGQNNHGDLQGGMSQSSVRIGKVGQALNFDGVDDRISVDNHSSLNPSAITITAWVKATSNPNCDGNDNYRSLLYKGPSPHSNTTGYDICWGEERYFVWDIGATDPMRYVPDYYMSLNTWTFIAFTYDSSSLAKAYFDGVQASGSYWNTGSGNIVSNTNALLINRSATVCPPNTGGNFPGLIDEVRIYSRALTPTEISEQYRAGARKFQIQSGQ